MRNLFQVAVKMTLQLIVQQVNLIKTKKAGTIKTLIICGGLGSSPYIKTKLDEFCEERFAGKMQVVRPVRGWSSICRGAALSGLEASPILSRRSRYHYGFVIHKTFDDDEHDEEDAFDDPVYGKRAKNQMRWFVKKVLYSHMIIFCVHQLIMQGRETQTGSQERAQLYLHNSASRTQLYWSRKVLPLHGRERPSSFQFRW